MKDKDNDSKKNDVARKGEIKKPLQQSREIRCYGKSGFFYPEKQEDGSVIQRFCYGREGD